MTVTARQVEESPWRRIRPQAHPCAAKERPARYPVPKAKSGNSLFKHLDRKTECQL